MQVRAEGNVGSILVVDDERSMREMLEILLRRAGHEVALASSGAEALERFGEVHPELVIQDLKMPGMPGLELLERLTERAPSVPVIVITAFSSWDNTVEAMRLGAHDYVKKPFDIDELRHTVERALVHARVRARVRPGEAGPLELVGSSAALREVIEVVRRVAPTEATVLLQGESGTGKELVARMCHYHSPRASKPFLVVNCGAFSESLLESELFGHVRGAFTGAISDKRGLLKVADGGTFFLDEVGELPLSTQVKLLRALETRQFIPVGGTSTVRTDVRFVCATNRDLEQEVREGRFRGDLFYRLNVIPITLPPLRERPEDIALLAGHFVRKYAKRLGREIRSISADARARLQAYSWPGNVRELENAIQRAIALASGPELTAVGAVGGKGGSGWESPCSQSLATWQVVAAPGDDPTGLPALLPCAPTLPEQGIDLELTLANAERVLIERALRKTNGNVTRAAELLGVTFRSLRYKIKKLGMRAEETP